MTARIVTCTALSLAEERGGKRIEDATVTAPVAAEFDYRNR